MDDGPNERLVMGLMDTLRKAEERGKQAARRGYEIAKDELVDAESLIRRKMRLHPKSAMNAQFRKAREFEDAERKAIVSVQGEDLPPDEGLVH